MPIVWVQHWSYLPVIVEDIDMGDGRQTGARLPSTQLPTNHPYSSDGKDGSIAACMCGRLRNHSPFCSHLTTYAAGTYNNIATSTFTTQGFGPQTLLKAGLMPGQQSASYGQGRGHQTDAFTMSGLGETLPEYLPPTGDTERSTNGVNATLHQQSPSPFAGQAPMANPTYGIYPQYATPYQQAAASAQAYSLSQLTHASQNAGHNTMQSPYSGHAYYPTQQQQQYLLYPGQFGQAGQHPQALPSQYAQPFGRGSNPVYGAGLSQPMLDVAGIPARVSQYGGFSPSGPHHYGYGSGVANSRLAIAPGKHASSAR